MSSREPRAATGEAQEPTEEELRAAYEAQIKQLRADHVLLETVVTLANLGMRRTGLAPGTEDERDPEQVRLVIDSMRALMPVIEQIAPQQVRAIRDALSQLQLGYVRIGGQAGSSAEAPERGATPGSAPGSGTAGPPPGSAGSGSGGSSPGDPGAGTPPRGAPPAGDQPPGQNPDEPGPAQRSGRLWVPGR